MKRLPFWTLVAVLLVDVAWLVSLSSTPESIAEGWEPLLSYPSLGFAGFVALLVGAVIQSRGVVWIIALGICVLGAVVWLLTAIAFPIGDIRWANAAAFAIAASSVLGLRWASPRVESTLQAQMCPDPGLSSRTATTSNRCRQLRRRSAFVMSAPTLGGARAPVHVVGSAEDRPDDVPPSPPAIAVADVPGAFLGHPRPSSDPVERHVCPVTPVTLRRSGPVAHSPGVKRASGAMNRWKVPVMSNTPTVTSSAPDTAAIAR